MQNLNVIAARVRKYVPMEGSYYDPMLLKVLSKTNLTIGELVKTQLLPIGHEFDHLCHLYSEGVIDMDVANRVMDYKMEVTKCR